MPKNDTGEFELVLGNRQLLSGFAVVAILFGVFFAMGYIVGRNSTPSSRTAAAEGQGSPITSAQPEPGRQSAPEPPANTPEAGGANAEKASSTPASEPAPAEPPPAPARQAENARPPEKAPEAPVRPQSADALPPGSYLQVIATIQTDAEVISRSLQERHFANAITPSSREGYYRVLVGPYRDSSGVGGAKTELEKLGFHPLLVKITEKN